LYQRFEEKTILITNAKGIIGSTCARLFHDEGANMVVNDKDKESMNKIRDELKTRILTTNEDLASNHGPNKMVNLALDSYGTIDVLIFNEECPQPRDMQEIDVDLWEKTVDQNLISIFHTLQAVYDIFKEKKEGSIVFVSSLGARSGIAGATNYTSSSGGVLGIMKSVSKEWSRWGVTCSAVCPGVIEENIQGIPTSMKKQFEQTQVELASVRNVTANEVAKVILFLASEDGKPINGQAINVDYGLYIYML
jgi:NAD(P)-dependent dehydrogenase (short-subunit alcohol dehydrogenase family)